MTSQSQTSRILDEEHNINLDLLNRVELAFGRAPRTGAASDPDLAKLAGTLGVHLERDVARHFEFEERELFPRLHDAGDGDLAALLLEEHAAIREVIAELLPLTRAAAAGTLDDPGWDALKRGAVELVERLSGHIRKETMALLPVVDNLLDEDTDRELAFAYAAS